MRIKSMLVVISFAFAIAPVLYPEMTSAYPKCEVVDCEKTGTHTRAEVHKMCKGAGIEYGQDASSGGFGCIDRANDQGWVQCDGKGECIAGRGVPPEDLKSLARRGTSPAKKSSPAKK